MDLSLYRIVTFPTLEPGAYLWGPGCVQHLDEFFRDMYTAKGVQRHESANRDFLASCKHVARGI